MRIGELTKLITIQYQTKVSDGMGGNTVTWVDWCQVWAAVWPLSAKEQVQGNQQTMTITGRIRIRYRANMKASMRLKYGNRYFNVVSIVNPNEGNEWLDLMVKEVA